MKQKDDIGKVLDPERARVKECPNTIMQKVMYLLQFFGFFEQDSLAQDVVMCDVCLVVNNE